MNKFLRNFSIPGREHDADLRQQRRRLLDSLLLATFVLGTIALIPAVIAIFALELDSRILILYVAIYVWAGMITFLRRLPYGLRLFSFLSLFYFFATIGLSLSGFNLEAGLSLLGFVCMAVVFFGLRGGLLAVTLAAVTLGIFGWLVVNGYIVPGFALPQSHPMQWILASLVLAMNGILLAVSVTSLLRGLQTSEDYYRTLIENSTDLTLILEADGTIRTVSPSVGRAFGYSQEELAGRSVFELIHPEDHKLPTAALTPGIPAEEIGPTIDVRVRHKDGTWRWLEVRGQAFFDHPAIHGAVVNARDITERKRAEQLLQRAYGELEYRVVERTAELQRAEVRYERLYQTMRDAFVQVDMQGRIRHCNQAFLDLIGYTMAEILRKTFRELTPAKWHAVDEQIVSSQIMPRGYSDLYEKECRRKDGRTFPVELRTVLLRDENGQPTGMWAFVRDISERKRSERILLDNEQRYRDLLDHSPQPMAVVQGRRIKYANRAMAILMNSPLEALFEFEMERFLPQLDPEARPHMEHWLNLEAAEIGAHETFPIQVTVAGDRQLWLDITALVIQYQGRPAIQFTAVDQTERKLTMDALYERDQMNHAILEATQLLVLVVDPQGAIVTVSDRFARQFGKHADDLLGTCAYDLLPAEISAIRRAKIDSVFETNQPLLFEDERGGRWFENSLYPMRTPAGQADRVIVLARDITERRLADQAVLESEARYRTLAEASPDMIFIIDRDDRIRYVNSFAASFLGLPMEEILDQPRNRFFPDPIGAHQQANLQKVIRSGQPFYAEAENRFLERSIWLGTWLVPLRDADGQVTGAMGISRDITARIRTEQKLRESEERYRSLAESAPEMIYIVDRQGLVQYVNPFGAELVGYKAEQIIGQPWSMAASAPVDQPGRNTLVEVLTSNKPAYVEGEYRVGERSLWLGSWLVPLHDGEGRLVSVLGISRDITERKRYEQALEQARDQLEQRVQERTAELEASQARMQQLAEQVITTQEQERRDLSRELHDEAGQMLITLKYSLATCLQELPEGSEASRLNLQEALTTLDNTINQVRDLAHSLRPPALDVAGLDLSLKELCQEISARTQLHVEYDGKPLPPLPDEIGISLYRIVQEALTNVLKHARATRVKVWLEYLHGQLLVTVSDNGQGMAAEAKEGIGLLGMRERIKLLDGELVLSSPRGKGTKLLVRVPWKEGPVAIEKTRKVSRRRR